MRLASTIPSHYVLTVLGPFLGQGQPGTGGLTNGRLGFAHCTEGCVSEAASEIGEAFRCQRVRTNGVPHQKGGGVGELQSGLVVDTPFGIQLVHLGGRGYHARHQNTSPTPDFTVSALQRGGLRAAFDIG